MEKLPLCPSPASVRSERSFFGRLKLNGKIVRQTLKTNVFTTAKLRLGNFIKVQHKHALRAVSRTFEEARKHTNATLTRTHFEKRQQEPSAKLRQSLLRT